MDFIDVSNYQAGLRLADVPHDAVIVKATEGGTTDPAFADFMAQSSGGLRGAYHFAHPELNSAAAEADSFVNVVRPHLDGQTLMVLDWEPVNGGNPGDTGWALAWCQRVRELTGVLPVVYTNFDVFDRYDWSAVVQLGCWFWISAYPDMNAQGRGNRWPVSIDAPLFAQQYSAAGSLPGYSAPLDLNECYIGADGWRALASGNLAGLPAPSFDLAAFENAVIGKPVDPDGAYGPQCVDLADYYAMAVFGLPWQEAIGAGNARDLLDVAPQTGHWRAELNTPTYVPPAGALVVYERTAANGRFGHVALVTSASMNSLTGLEQNAPEPFITQFRRGYDGVVGFLVPVVAEAARGGGNAVPVAPPAIQPTAENTATPAPAGGFAWWIVDPGDTLSGIATVNGTTVERLLALNPQITNPDAIFVGQRIELTGDAQPAPATSGFQWWDVDPGDTLSGIAAANGTTVQRLLELNPQITNPDAIYVGQRINLV